MKTVSMTPICTLPPSMGDVIGKTYKILSVVTWAIGFSSLYCLFKIIYTYYVFLYSEKQM